MKLVNPDAAGIDVGDTLFAVAVPVSRDEVCVREFGTFTCDLMAIVAWLKLCCIRTVAMEATGVYWKQLFSVLVREGFDVNLVHAAHTKNVTGRKTDESDAMWIQKLHSCGLLSSCFLPDDRTETLRTLVRFRKTLIRGRDRYVLRMQKSLELMNIKVHTVISDLMGKTGTAIVEAIINGERSPEGFLPFIDRRVKADKETLLKSLEGNWRQEHLATMRFSYEMYKTYGQKIAECDKEIETALQNFIAFQNDGDVGVSNEKAPAKKKKHRKAKNHPQFDTHSYLLGIHGVDVMEIYGISETSALEILAETGTDLSKWASEKKFVSWLNLCPNNKISGGKLISSSRLKKKPNLAAQAFRAAANSLGRSDHWLGDYFRRMKSKGGNKYAIVATARKLAIIYYKMVRYKQEFNPVDLKEYQQKHKAAKIAYLERTLEKLRSTG